MWTRFCCMAVVATALAAPAQAQEKGKDRKRPELEVGSDSNSALAYYRQGLRYMDTQPSRAADALYWATRIEPGWPEALYAFRVAAIRADQPRMLRLLRGDRKTIASPEVQQLDSLLLRAYANNPFLHRSHDPGLIRHYLTALVEDDVRRQGSSGDVVALRGEIQNVVNSYLATEGGLEFRAWLAFGEGRFPEALDLYGKILGTQHKMPEAHDDRATIFFQQKQYAAAAAELSHALSDFEKRDKKRPVVLYQSKAVYEFKLGTVYALQEKLDTARTAFQRALEEDLSFYPAHIVLSNLAIMQGDTATALRELDLAVSLAPEEPRAPMEYAELLLATGDPQRAQEVLAPVVAAWPWYAEPNRLLGRAAEAVGAMEEARARYSAFMRLAPRGHQQLAAVELRLRTLGGRQ